MILFCRRQLDPEVAAARALGFNTDPAAHLVGGFADDGQADAGALI
jgi:hypothetical protein